MNYKDVVDKAKKLRETSYGYGKVSYEPCKTWLIGNQINLWTYWQGFQLEVIDERGVDIMLVGQDWGNPKAYPELIKRIEEIQDGNKTATYITTTNPTDKTLTEMFKAFGENIDITKRNSGMRLFFTNYSLGYREGAATGGMTKKLMREDEELFNDLVLAIKPKIIICLGKITYEMVSKTTAKNFTKQLKEGMPFESVFPKDNRIKVFGVAHCGSRGLYNVGGRKNMFKAWEQIALRYRSMG